MRGISFDYSRPLTPADPNRMDIACFVGFVPRRRTVTVPPEVVDWLVERRWAAPENAPTHSLLNVPVPIESWQGFHELFAWDQRLDGRLVIAGRALADDITIGDDNRSFKLVIDRQPREVELDVGAYTPQSLAAFLDSRLEDVQVSIDELGQDRHLMLEYSGGDGRGDITVFTHVESGFPAAVSRGNAYLESYLGAAVKAFFAQGGRKCYVVRLGDPLPLSAAEGQRVAQLAHLLTGNPGLWPGADTIEQLINAYLPPLRLSQDRPETWQGVEHLLGLGDVSYLTLPDLPELVSRAPTSPGRVTPPPAPEVFVECSRTLPGPRSGEAAPGAAPICAESGYRVWTRAVHVVLRFLRGMAREVHLVAGLPLPGAEIDRDFKSFVLEELLGDEAAEGGADIRSAFLQLCYPWLKTSQSDGLPQGALPPDGVLTGMLAANALSAGVFNSTAGNPVPHAYDLFPLGFFTPSDEMQDPRAAFYRHVSVFARAPGRIELISDVTASRDESYRPAVVSRLTSLLVRAARNQGRSSLFEPMSHATWRSVEKSLSNLLQSVFEAGGLRGPSAAQAYEVQCDESTMSGNDIDNGRLIATVSFQPAIPVQRIRVALSLQQDGHVEVRGAA